MIELVGLLREENPSNYQNVISLDSGKNYLKIIWNNVAASERHEQNHSYKDGGVRKCIILAIVEDVQESYYNVRTIFVNSN